MIRIRFLLRAGAAIAAAAAVAGCARERTAYETEDFTRSNTYSRSYPASQAAACDAARRALLSQGYNLDKAAQDGVTGHKNFQDEDGRHAQVIFNITCAPDTGSDGRSTVFVNALQDQYSIKKTSNSASVGVSVLGAVSLPFGAGDDSMVKTSSETITRKSFYDGFFGLLQQYLPASQAATPAASGPSPPASTPPPPPTSSTPPPSNSPTSTPSPSTSSPPPPASPSATPNPEAGPAPESPAP